MYQQSGIAREAESAGKGADKRRRGNAEEGRSPELKIAADEQGLKQRAIAKARTITTAGNRSRLHVTTPATLDRS
jgi:hypothetical protein